MNGQVSATFWAQVQPVWWKWSPAELRGARVLRITKSKPRKPDPGCVLVRLTLSLPVDAFVPREMHAETEISHSQITTPAQLVAEELGYSDG
jgi:hypothetical protein